MRQEANETAPMLPIGVLAKRNGLTVEGIRFYEKTGILPPPARTAGGRRVYSLRELKRLGFVRRARDLGFTLDEVRCLLRLVDEARAHNCAEARELATGHLAGVRAKIADLRRMERVLSAMVTRCAEGRTPECPLIDALFSQDSHTLAGRTG